jgi:uncharacterized membrane protein
MTVDVQTQIDIERPRHDVAAYVSNPDNATEWYENIHAVEWETSPPLEKGSRIRFTARFLGRSLNYTYEVREYAPDERLVMGTTSGPLEMETTYSFEDASGGGTRVSLRNRGERSGFAKILRPVMEAAIRRANKKDLRRLKGILERREVS